MHPAIHPHLSAIQLRDAIRSRELSPVELMVATLARANRLEPQLNAFASLDAEPALESARAAEAAVMAGGPLGPLHGIPISVKDVIAVRGLKLRFGSRLTSDAAAMVDAPAVERLRQAGACLVGKTTTSEFGGKAVGDSPLTGVTRNPWNLVKTPGGSSGGAAASIASGIVPLALGTDGGGSVRIPCALTGLFGLKPQFGRVPFFPASATPRLAHVGPMARTVRDAALLLAVIAGHDSRDPLSLALDPPGFLAACELPPAGLRLAWSPTLGYARPKPQVLQIAALAAEALARIVPHFDTVECVLPEDPALLWATEFYAGIGSRIDCEPPERRALVDPALLRAIADSRWDSASGADCDGVRRNQLNAALRELFEKYDLLLTPTVPVPAFNIGLNRPPGSGSGDPVTWAQYTYPFNLTGHPAASIPAGFTREGLPVGLQLISAPGRETDILRAAAAFEAARPWNDRWPEPTLGSDPDKAGNGGGGDHGVEQPAEHAL